MATDTIDPKDHIALIKKAVNQYMRPWEEFLELFNECYLALVRCCEEGYYDPSRGKLSTLVFLAVKRQISTWRYHEGKFRRCRRKSGKSKRVVLFSEIGNDVTTQVENWKMMATEHEWPDLDEPGAEDGKEEKLLGVLRPAWAEIVRMHAGLRGPPMTMRAIARHYGVTIQAIAEKLKKAYKKMRDEIDPTLRNPDRRMMIPGNGWANRKRNVKQSASDAT